MRYRTLGKTGLQVSELSMGGLFVASFAASLDEARSAVHRAFDLGVNFVDTAPGYHDSEQVLGEILKDVRQPYLLSTKLGGRPQPTKPRCAVRWKKACACSTGT
jgi:aryl-alcohol dehydrogenase-like predicted oxidoreductase